MAYLDLETGQPGTALRKAPRAHEATEFHAPSARHSAWLLRAGNAALIALIGTIVAMVYRFALTAVEAPGMALIVTALLLLPAAPLLTPRRR